MIRVRFLVKLMHIYDKAAEELGVSDVAVDVLLWFEAEDVVGLALSTYGDHGVHKVRRQRSCRCDLSTTELN